MGTDDAIHESVTAQPNRSAKEKFGADVVQSLERFFGNRFAMTSAMRKDAEAPKQKTETTVTTKTTTSQTRYLDDYSF